jgi:wyosine [tRNA(Phe)-imidazoG37] synthetase (radical SAM superfamily)
MTNDSAQPIWKYVFGPVPSRRLGLSLGVDLVPHKTCTYDCVYCQINRTTVLTLERREYNPTEQILREVREALERGPRPDYITLSGSGEPTLHVHFGDLIRSIKSFTDVPVALLTNGSLFCEPEVRRDACGADLVLPSLDAGDESAFRRVNRPHQDLALEQVVEGLAAFRKEFTGQIWLEVFLVAGDTDTPEAALRIKALADRIQPDRIQLNTAVRPTADADVEPLPQERMEELAQLFGPAAEVIANYPEKEVRSRFTGKRDDVLAMLQRRPCTIEDIARGLGIHRHEAIKHVTDLSNSGLVTTERRGEGQYFKAR